MRTRADRIQTLKRDPAIQVLIIGAGINGIGTFLDLALQGIHVVMVDKGDYCSGASATSSHMVHGGIRYLENGEFRLVREAIQERNILLHTASHVVKPLPTTIPIFSLFSGLLNAPLKLLKLRDQPTERGALLIKLGLMLYDSYAGKDSPLPKHSTRSKTDALEQFPRLNPQIRSTATYYDASMSMPERIAIELILDAEKESTPAIPLNYMRLTGMHSDAVELKDELSGETLTVRPQIVINAGGAWIDEINAELDQSTAYIGGTKGSHIVLDHPELYEALNGHEFFFEHQDRRIVLLCPLADRVLVGTSDLPVAHPEEAVITSAEIDYFLEMTRLVFPSIQVSREHIVYTFSGVRPLPASDAAAPGQVSRDHHIHFDAPTDRRAFPVLSLIGGKWTTYRAFAEQVTDTVLAHFDRPRVCSTRDWRIGGSHEFPENAIARDQFLWTQIMKAKLEKEHALALFERYGTRLKKMVTAVGESLNTPLNSLPQISFGEIRFFAEHEDVHHLEDLLFRRTTIAKLGWITPESLVELAGITADALGWDTARQKEEVDAVIAHLNAKHGMAYNRLAD
jgi:glycerol-3-phosphate dehydrogenase